MNSTATTYQIKVQGKLDPKWADWFGDLDLNMEANGLPITIITGRIADQSALRGILVSLGLPPDVLANSFFIQSDRAHAIAAGPDTLTPKPFSQCRIAVKQAQCQLALQESHHVRYGVLRWN